MRKKFLSAFLLGALAIATTSTMVSCKDYDDDIKSLKGQIKSLEDLVAQKEATINSSIANLQSLIDKANNDHATKAALESAKKELEDAIKANYNSIVEQDTRLSAAIDAAQTKADAAYSLASENKEAIGNLVNDLATANEKLGTLSEGLKAANEEIARLGAALEAQKAELENAIKDAKAELTEADKEILKQAQAEIKALEDKLAAADKELDAKITEEIDKVSEAIKGVEASVDELQIAHNEVAAEVKTLVNTTIPAVRQEIQVVAGKISDVDSKYDVITKVLARSLRSLVYIPNLYVDGIETIEYAFIKDTTLVEKKGIVVKRQRTDFDETYEKQLTAIEDYEYKDGLSQEWVYGPAWPVEYHMNPSNSKTTWDKVVGWNCREVEVATRAAVTDLGEITSPEKYDNGNQLFLNKDGILTVGLKIEKPKPLLANGPVNWKPGETGNQSYGKDNIVSLKVKSEAAENAGAGEKDTIITSDYAMLYPEVVHPEAIVWTTDNDRVKLSKGDEDVSHSYASATEVKCPLADKKYHVWDKPEEALAHTQGPDELFGQPDILLPYNSEEGVMLSKMIGTHFFKYCGIKNHTEFGAWKFGEEQFWGLKFIFEPVFYLVDTNKTSDSRYCTIDKYTGQIIARDVDTEGNTIANKPATNNNNSVVGREPLVRIRLVDAATETKTFLDAYVLVRITKAVQELVDVIDEYPVQEHTFNLCDAHSFKATTWAEFDNYVLDHLNLTKEQFDAQYELDTKPFGPISSIGGGYWYRANVFEQIITDKDTTYIPSTYTCPANNKKVDLGSVDYFMNEVGTTNHTFRLSLTEDELEYLTHDKTLPVNFKRYVRYVGKSSAKYKYIYIKLEAKLDREADPETGIKDKIQQYWFALDGDAAGWDAVALNILSPNGTSGTPIVWNNELLSTFTANGVENMLTFTDNNLNGANSAYLTRNKEYRKFFFAPINTTIKDSCLCNDPNNTVDEWTITAKSSAKDEKWNAFVCHYNICCAENHEDIEHAAITGHNVNYETIGGLTGFNPEYRNYDDHTVNLHYPKTYTTHKFQVKDGKSDDAANSAILQKCAIDYRDGCFTNDVLYATKDGVNYTPIVRLDQATGRLTLIRPNKQNPQDESRYDYVPESVLDKVLNAVGYWGDRHQNISDELHTWVGVVVNNGCGVARDLFTVHGENNNNYSIFEASWQRPINLREKDPEPIEDAKNNGEIIPVYKHLSFFDWRGPVEGSMEGLYKWLWGYYNIHRIAFDLNPDKVLTNMHQSSPETFVVLSKVSKDVHLYAYKSWNYVTGTGVSSDQGLYKFDNSFDLRGFANQVMNDNLIAYLNLNMGEFGYIFYENNGQNVNTFSVKVPISIYYEWGHFDTYMTIEIKSTKGNQNGI